MGVGIQVVALILLVASDVFAFHPGCTRHNARTKGLPSSDFNELDLVPAPAEKMTASARVTRVLSRDEGQTLMQDTILPKTEYWHRIAVGRDAQGLHPSSAVSPNDPRMFLTYGEFPLSSMDELLDLALPHVADPSRIDMLDVGSGCGRLALYVALTRPWQVHGVEISPVLHHEAAQALAKGYQGGYFTDLVDTDSTSGSIHLHAGAAEEWTDILRRCNVIFAYSTAWPTCRFSEQWGAMIIGQQWSGLLSQSCARGTVVVTTDRALDPQYGWDLVDKLDVDNREVMGSAGYVHVLRC